MTLSIREEVDRRLASNQEYYAHFVTDADFPRIRKDTTNDILKIIEKRIDELRHTDELELQDEEVDYGITLFHDKIKEMLK